VSVLEELPAGSRGVDAFAVLGLPYSPDLTDAEVHAAYLLRLRAVHPDSGGDAGAAAAVTAAYDALRSGVRRGELLAAVTIDRDTVPVEVGRGLRRGRGQRAGRSAPAGHERPGTGRVPDVARREELWRKMAAARVEQGLPPYITDEATLDKIADLLVVTLGRGDRARPAHGRPVGAAAPRERAGRPAVFEPSSWRRESRRQYAAERERAGAAPEQVVSGWWLARGWLRLRYGRPGWLAARVVLAVVVVVVAEVVAPGDPAVWALGVGAVTWLVRTGRWDLAPRARR
jgi:hypothetical protein